jgi:hypothetical protein
VATHSAAQYAAGHAKGADYASFLDSAGAWAANLRAQGYARVVTVLVAFQWSSPDCGPPWDRIDQSPPPRRAAGDEIEDAFRAERLARTPDIRRPIEENGLLRAGPVAILDASVLGAAIAPKAKARRLGQALEIEHELDPLERQFLAAMEGRFAAPELLRFCRQFDAPEPAVLGAIRSLLRKRLVMIQERG